MNGFHPKNKQPNLHAEASRLILSAELAKATHQKRKARRLFAQAARIEDRLSELPTTTRRVEILVSAASCYVEAGDMPHALDCLGRLCKLRPATKRLLADIQSVARHIATIV